MIKRDKGDIFASRSHAARIDDTTVADFIGQKPAKLSQTICHLIVERCSRLDFSQIKSALSLDHDIRLNTMTRSHEIQFSTVSAIQHSLAHVHDNQVLKQTADERMRCNLVNRADPQKIAGKTHIRKIDLRCLDETLTEVLMVRSQDIDDIRTRIYTDPGVILYSLFSRETGTVLDSNGMSKELG